MHRLCDLHDLVAGEHAEHAPVALAGVHVGETELRVLRQHALGLGQIQPHAVSIPDLDHQRVVAGAVPRRAVGSGSEWRVRERCGHLLQLMVEQLVGFHAGAKIGADRCGGDGDRQSGEQPEEQLAADRRQWTPALPPKAGPQFAPWGGPAALTAVSPAARPSSRRRGRCV